MTTSTTLPVTITPEAASRIAELGFQAEVDRMIDYARQNIPELTRIEVMLYDRYELGSEPGLAVVAYSRHDTFDVSAKIDDNIARWATSEFPPEVIEHLILSYACEGPDAR